MVIMSTEISQKIKNEAQELVFKLNQILKISQLWLNVQCKWLFLGQCIQSSTSLSLDEDTLSQYCQSVKEFTV